jgi:hypothetical protein
MAGAGILSLGPDQQEFMAIAERLCAARLGHRLAAVNDVQIILSFHDPRPRIRREKFQELQLIALVATNSRISGIWIVVARLVNNPDAQAERAAGFL